MARVKQLSRKATINRPMLESAVQKTARNKLPHRYRQVPALLVRVVVDELMRRVEHLEALPPDEFDFTEMAAALPSDT